MKLLNSLGLIGASLLFALVMAEAVLRILNPDILSAELALFVNAPNESGSYRLKPDIDLVTRFSGMTIPIKTNSQGMRWHELNQRLKPDRARIAVVGDSFVFGQWAEDVEHSLVGIFEDYIGSEKYEVLNYGVPGYGFVDIRLLYEDEIAAQNPDFLVLVSYSGNDFLDTYLGPKRYKVVRDGVLEVDRQIIDEKIPASFRSSGFKFSKSLADSSYLLRLLRAVLQTQLVKATANQTDSLPESPDESYTSDIFWSLAELPEFARVARKVSLSELELIARACKSNGTRLLLVTLPYKEQLYSPQLFGGRYDRDLPQRYLADFAASQGIEYLDVRPALADYYAKHEQPLHHLHDGHFNNEGHRISGESLGEFFLRVNAAP